MHLPATALPGAGGLYLDAAAATVRAQVFGPRIAAVAAPQLELESPFIAPTLINSWSNYGAGFLPAGFYKDRAGVVHLRGLIKDGSATVAAFVLPAGCRPAGPEVFAAIANNALARVDVLADGSVVLVTGSNVFLSLSGITFRAA